MIPQKIKVGAMVYEVKVVPDMYKDRSLLGEVVYNDPVIKIADDISEQRKTNAFLHELTHAVLFESGDMSDQDEAYVRRFSNLLTQVFYDNGWTFGKDTE